MSERSKLMSKNKSKSQKVYSSSGKKKRLYKFNPMFTAEWPCVIACDFSEYHTYCKLCDQVISVAHKGRAGVYRHITSNRHIQNSAGAKSKIKTVPDSATPTQPEVIRVSPARTEMGVKNCSLVKSKVRGMSRPICRTQPLVIRLTSEEISSVNDGILPQDVLQCIALEGSYPLNVEMNDSSCEGPSIEFPSNVTINGVDEQVTSVCRNFQSSTFQQKFKLTTDMDDVNYMFGLSVIANLRQLSEKQASLARLKMQSILHEVTYNYQ